MGHWVVKVPNAVKADIEVILHPSMVTGNRATLALKVGDQLIKRKSAAGSIRFKAVKLPAGEVRLEAIRTEGDHQTGAYQLIVNCHLK